MTYCAELADFHWLTGSEAAGMLVDLAGRTEPLHAATARLRRLVSAARAHLLLEQVDLRRRAGAKFADPETMFFTKLGLEQSTDQWVAASLARRFAGRGSVADFCCGIGGDLLALAAVSRATGVDRDPVALCLASANAESRQLHQRVVCRTDDVDQVDPAEFDAWHLDPDRRPHGHRTTGLDWSSPSLESVERLLAAAPNAAIKLAPAAEVPISWRESCELEWISRDRQCRQLVAWHGSLVEERGCRRATILGVDGDVARSFVGQPEIPLPYASQFERFLFEPDSAVLAARLTGALASEHGLSAIAAGIAYLTGPVALDDPALTCFEVCDTLPLDLRHLAAHLRDRNVGRLEIKKRGVEHDPATVRKQLRLSGDEAATLFLTKLGGKHVAIVARRIEQPPEFSSLPPASRILHPAP